MVTKGLQTFVAVAMCAGALRVTSPAATTGSTPTEATQRPVLAPVFLLRSGLEPPAADGQTLLLSVTAADIDADGDLDVVGSDGSLNLIVWANDGTGRLTRRYPRDSSSGGWTPTGATVDGQPDGSTVLALFGSPSLDSSDGGSSFFSTPSQWRAPPGTSSPQPQFASTRIPRAPPSLLLL